MADFRKQLETLKNWGKWGAEDERGALNYITPEKRQRAAGLVKRGVPISLAMPITHGQGPQTGMGGRTNPQHRADCRGERHRKGADRQCAARKLAPPRAALSADQLCRHPAGLAGERAVRP